MRRNMILSLYEMNQDEVPMWLMPLVPEPLTIKPLQHINFWRLWSVVKKIVQITPPLIYKRWMMCVSVPVRLPQQSFQASNEKSNVCPLQTVTICNTLVSSPTATPTILHYSPSSNGQYYIPGEQQSNLSFPWILKGPDVAWAVVIVQLQFKFDLRPFDTYSMQIFDTGWQSNQSQKRSCSQCLLVKTVKSLVLIFSISSVCLNIFCIICGLHSIAVVISEVAVIPANFQSFSIIFIKKSFYCCVKHCFCMSDFIYYTLHSPTFRTAWINQYHNVKVKPFCILPQQEVMEVMLVTTRTLRMYNAPVRTLLPEHWHSGLVAPRPLNSPIS